MSNYDPGKDPLLMDHESDGIRELDNNLPRWWVWLFYLTIIFAVLYMGYYHVFKIGDLQAAEYTKDFKAGEAVKGAAMAAFEAKMASVEPSKDTNVIAHGHEIFLKYCAICHRPDGGGLVGPNLCDDYWIHGSNFVDNLRTIYNGVPAKGMLTWKGVLKPDEILSVGSFIYTLRGTHPPNPKPPENQTGPAKPNIYD